MASSRETAAVDQLVAAKDAYKKNPTDKTRAARDEAVDEVQQIRADEREGRDTMTVGGDAVQEG